MSQTNDDGSAWIIGAGIVVGIFSLLVWFFADAVGLDFGTGLQVVLGMLAVLALACGAWYSEIELIRFGNMWALYVSAIWVAWWPALDHWAAKQYPSFVSPENYAIWWSAWYTRWGVLIGFIATVYLIRNMQED